MAVIEVVLRRTMKEKQTQMWIPLYVDKWIFGSTRIELEPAERGVFVDLLAWAAKDNGFIRANESTPYHHSQLAGLLNIPVELLESTIDKCLHFAKIEEPTPGIYRLKNWDGYQLSDDYKYRLSTGKRLIPGLVRQNSDNCPTNPGPIREEKRREEKREEEKREHTTFEQFWSAYPKRVGKEAAHKSWLKHNPPLDLCLKTLEWQKHLEQWTKDKGQFIPLPATWINQHRWTDEPLNAQSGPKTSKSSVLRPIVDTEWKPEYDFNLEDAKFKGGR